MCSYDGSGSWPHAIGFLLLGLVALAVTALPKVNASKPWSRALVALGIVLLVVAVWTFSTDPFTNPTPCGD